MSVQSVKKRYGCTLATAHKKIQHTLAGAEKSVKYRVWPGRNKAYFYNTICRETQNSPAKVFTKSAGLPAKRRPLRFFTPRPNTTRKFSSCRSDKGYQDKILRGINRTLYNIVKQSHRMKQSVPRSHTLTLKALQLACKMTPQVCSLLDLTLSAALVYVQS